MAEVDADVVIRPAVAADIDAVAALWSEAFPGERTASERARMLETGGRYGGLETVLVARDAADRLLGACKMYRLTQHVAGAAMPMMGLAAVAVAPGARRQGLGARICIRAIETARERHDVISVLYPFRPAYYERLGWGLVGELHEYRFRTDTLPAYEEARHVRGARHDHDGDAIAECYARVAARSNGPIERDDRVWANRLAGEQLGTRPVAPAGPRHQIVVHERDGLVGGYALLRWRSALRAVPSEIRVRELVADTEEAYRGILGYLARQAGQWPIARHTARIEERFGDRLSDPRPPGGGRARSLYFPTACIIRGPMLRLIDVPRALAARRYFEARRGGAPRTATIQVQVDDPQVPQNQGPWHVRIQGDEVRVSPASGSDADARIHTDAPTLARIFAGDLTPGDAGRLGPAATDGDADLLDRAFATTERYWLLDEF
jgi:predicted N-acetyltransferase YhbS